MGENLFPLDIRVLGPIDVRVEGRRIGKLRSAKGLWLLGLLALKDGKEVDRKWLSAALWPDSDPDNALATLRRTLTDLKTALGSQGFRLRTPSQTAIYLDVDSAFVDAVAFQDLALSPDERIGLYAGPVLEGCEEEWVWPERTRLEEAYVELLEKQAAAKEEEKDLAGAAAAYSRLRAADPLRESATAGLMRVFVAKGDQAAAVQAYRDLRETLLSQLNREPSDSMKVFVKGLRDQARAVVHTKPAPETKLIPRSVQTSFPRPLTPMVGREDELAQLVELATEKRLITLIGMGGMGKTRLALAFCEWAEANREGDLAFVDLSGVGAEENLAQSVLEHLGITLGAGQLAEERLSEKFASGDSLLVLDNCEQVIQATAALAGELLKRCASLVIVTTSRQPLGIYGEELLRIGSLALPSQNDSLDRISNVGAVKLFLERARAAAPNFAPRVGQEAVLVRLCERLDGCPLAIELAASRLRAMSLEQLEARLSDRFALLKGSNQAVQPRQQTLRAVIDWSYDLLSDAEKKVFRELGILASSFSLEAAEAISEDEDCWDTLAGLVDRSLVWTRESYDGIEYRLLESARDYAREKLKGHDEVGAVRHRLALYMLKAGEAYRRGIYDHRAQMTIRFFVRYADDFRNLLHHLVEVEPDIEIATPLALNIYTYWSARGYYREAVRWMRALLPLIPKTSALYPEFLNRYSYALVFGEDGTNAKELSAEGVAIAQGLGNDEVLLSARNNYGKVLEALGEFTEAEEYFKANLELALSKNLRPAEHIAYHNLGICAHFRGDYEQAEGYGQKVIAYAKESNNVHWLSWAYGNIAGCFLMRKQLDVAYEMLSESTRFAQDVGNLHALVQNMLGFALCESGRGEAADSRKAARLVGASLAARRNIGFAQTASDHKEYAMIVENLSPFLSDEEFEREKLVGEAMDLEEALRYATGESEEAMALRVVSGSG